jgi:hypothetical protein
MLKVAEGEVIQMLVGKLLKTLKNIQKQSDTKDTHKIQHTQIQQYKPNQPVGLLGVRAH